MASFMERLQRAMRFVEGNAPSYLRDHPITFERIAEAQARAATTPYHQVEDSLEFQMVRALLKSYQGTPMDAVTFFETSLAEKKYNNAIAAQYGLVASLLRAQDFKRGMVELTKLEKIAPPNPMVEAMAGQLLMQSGDLSAAIARYQSALQRYPTKLQLVYDYPEALLSDKQLAKAAAFLVEQLQRYPNDGRLNEIAGRVYAALGKQMLAHWHQGEYYAWQGNLTGAVTQLELAVKAGDGDFYQQSVVETRLRQMRETLASQDKTVASGGIGG
jgi:predicted Zn-dependent protease